MSGTPYVPATLPSAKHMGTEGAEHPGRQPYRSSPPARPLSLAGRDRTPQRQARCSTRSVAHSPGIARCPDCRFSTSSICRASEHAGSVQPPYSEQHADRVAEHGTRQDTNPVDDIGVRHPESLHRVLPPTAAARLRRTTPGTADRCPAGRRLATRLPSQEGSSILPGPRLPNRDRAVI